MKTNIIISPSGKLYGSEYVLFDFLKGSDKTYDIYVPKGSVFYNKLKKENYKVYGFTNLKRLYILVFFRMLFGNKNTYLNESGHINYIKILAKLLPNRKFVVSVRLVEDCNDKLNMLPHNITLISVSKFIKSKINSNVEPIVIYDPYELTTPTFNEPSHESELKSERIKFGVVGRITKSKGGDNLVEILNYFNSHELNSCEICFFGSYDENDEWFIDFKSNLNHINGLKYHFKGFVANKEDVYNSVSLLIHLNKEEPLGRILFESIDYSLRALVYKEGGIGELANELDLSLITMADSLEYANVLKRLINNGQFIDPDWSHSKKIILDRFSAKRYSESIERFL